MHRKAETRGTESSVEHDSDAAAARARKEQSEAATAGADLDFEALDLSIETVEERISPSETNVFDK